MFSIAPLPLISSTIVIIQTTMSEIGVPCSFSKSVQVDPSPSISRGTFILTFILHPVFTISLYIHLLNIQDFECSEKRHLPTALYFLLFSFPLSLHSHTSQTIAPHYLLPFRTLMQFLATITNKVNQELQLARSNDVLSVVTLSFF